MDDFKIFNILVHFGPGGLGFEIACPYRFPDQGVVLTLSTTFESCPNLF